MRTFAAKHLALLWAPRPPPTAHDRRQIRSLRIEWHDRYLWNAPEGRLGFAVAFAGNLLADLATFAGARLAGGARGSDVDLGPDGRAAVLLVSVSTYGTCQVVFVGLTVLAFAIAGFGRRFWIAVSAAWVGFALLSFALCLVPSNLRPVLATSAGSSDAVVPGRVDTVPTCRPGCSRTGPAPSSRQKRMPRDNFPCLTRTGTPRMMSATDCPCEGRGSCE
jgi:hypothetical protein